MLHVLGLSRPGRTPGPVGRTSNLVGRTSTLVGRTSNLVGRTSSLLGRTSRPGRYAMPRGGGMVMFLILSQRRRIK